MHGGFRFTYEIWSLPETTLKEFKEFNHWIIHKTANRFSAIPVDQAHKQNNEAVKGAGGAVGLTENPTAFRKYGLRSLTSNVTEAV